MVLSCAVLLGACRSAGPPPVRDAVPSGWPVARQLVTITCDFGPRSGRQHTGIDLAAPRGTPVIATAAGTVTLAGRSGQYGKTVVINHDNGYETCYAHLSKLLVREGEPVQRGQQVGRVGRSGNATGYHLHYEVRRHSVAVDPLPFLDRSPTSSG